jgi:hypothetical protein
LPPILTDAEQAHLVALALRSRPFNSGYSIDEFSARLSTFCKGDFRDGQALKLQIDTIRSDPSFTRDQIFDVNRLMLKLGQGQQQRYHAEAQAIKVMAVSLAVACLSAGVAGAQVQEHCARASIAAGSWPERSCSLQRLDTQTAVFGGCLTAGMAVAGTVRLLQERLERAS